MECEFKGWMTGGVETVINMGASFIFLDLDDMGPR